MAAIGEFLETHEADADSSAMKITARHFADAVEAAKRLMPGAAPT